MRKLASFLLAFALAVIPFGAAFATKGNQGPSYKLEVSADVGENSVTATAEVKLERGRDWDAPKKANGTFTFILLKGEEEVDSKTANINYGNDTTKASVTFDNVQPGEYTVRASFDGKLKTEKGREKRHIKLSSSIDCKIEEPQSPEEPKEEPKQPEQPQQPGNNDGQNGSNNDGKNGAQQPGGNENKGTNGGSTNNGGQGGTIQNPGSGNQQGGQLPKTATSLPMNAMIGGLLTLAGGAILFARRLVG